MDIWWVKLALFWQVLEWYVPAKEYINNKIITMIKCSISISLHRIQQSHSYNKATTTIGHPSYKTRFQMHWDSKILLNCHPLHCSKGGLIKGKKGGILYYFCFTLKNVWSSWSTITIHEWIYIIHSYVGYVLYMSNLFSINWGNQLIEIF